MISSLEAVMLWGLFYFIGNSVSYEIKNAPQGSHCGGAEKCRQSDPPQASVS